MIAKPVGRQRTIRARQRALLRWYRVHGRHTLPWRLTRDPYGILVSEVMLQQTQVDRVIPYWTAWMLRWPTLAVLARARRASVIRAWSGLGYNRRAVYLHTLAQAAVRDPSAQQLFSYSHELENSQGQANRERGLRALPGIGPYTANALLAFAWNQPAPCVDTNVRRVLAHAIYRRPAIMRMPLRQVMRLAARVIPQRRGREWNYALMDYGALVLRARDVPNRPVRRTAQFTGSSRFWRGRIVAVLRGARKPMPAAVLRTALMEYGEVPETVDTLLTALVRDRVIRAGDGAYRLG